MKKTYTILGIIIGIIIIVLIFLFINHNKTNKNVNVLSQAEAENAVLEFGKVLQRVPLTADKDIIVDTIQKEYSPYITKDLLNTWTNDTSLAPGREVSSPWPDHIEITETRKVGDEYQINGHLIYMTSNEVEHGGNAGVRDVSAIINIYQDKPLISNFLMAEMN